MNFPDQHHFEQIRRRLWCNRDFGQAAVMVGAGFSRNAEKIELGTPNMPTWKELAEQLYDELYPQNFPDREKIKKAAISNPLSLASEYEAIFGRLALNDFLTRAIPNEQYNPSKLHKLLMSIPWSDIFTTNYDSLLERTRSVIHDRKYELICRHEDVPGKMKPRIVKLHGSFPSHHPFIFTEEDYRTYPKKFAPFVNMVQQSIMENAFCLIGFSGDDPNFLSWIGWVRDNFGDLAPPIYLVGMDFSDARKTVLKQKNILTIDLSPLFPREKWSDSGLRHAKALEWFLLSLKNVNAPNLMNWPESNDVKDDEIKKWERNDSLPKLLSDSFSLTTNFVGFHPHGEMSEETIKQQHSIWRETRITYPGWVVCPRENREKLWVDTRSWVDKTFDFAKELSAPDDIFIIYELNWRLEITLTPLFTDWINAITTCLEKYNPYPNLLSINNAYIMPNKTEYKNFDWKQIAEMWIELAFALCRVAREDHNETSFNLWIGYLDLLVDSNAKYKSQYFYEKCLFHIFRFEDQQTRQVLQTWSFSLLSFDFWEVKRAAIYAELGDVKEAERIAELALDKIRSRQQAYLIDYSLYSQEGWAMYLLQIVKGNQELQISEEDESPGYRQWFSHYLERWSQLMTFRCNPHDELERLAERIDRVPESPKRRKEERQSFYPGTISTTYHYSNQEIWYSALPAFNILRMLEAAGIPISCGSSIPYYAGRKAAKWIKPYSPLWSITSIIRARGDSDCVDSFFTFIYISVLSQEVINYLYLRFYEFLLIYTQKASSRVTLKNVHELEKIALVIELISRICFRLDDERLKQLLNVTIDLYKDVKILDRSTVSGGVKDLFRGIFYTLSYKEIINVIPEMLSLPIGGEKEYKIYYTDNIPEPFNYIEVPKYSKQNNTLKGRITNQIKHLIQIIKQSDLDVRSRAILRVSKLFESGYLSSAEIKQFAISLWSKLDSESQLPEGKYLKRAFLLLPEPKSGIAKQRWLNFLMSKERINPFNDVDYLKELVGSVNQLTLKEQKLIWSSEYVIRLSEKILDCWKQYKNAIIKSITFSHIVNQTDLIAPDLIKIISYILLPHLSDVDNQIKEEITSLIKDFDDSGFCVIEALPMMLFIQPDEINMVSKKMKLCLTSNNNDEIQKADCSLFYWLSYSSINSIPKPSSDLLDILVNRVVTRHQPGLDTALFWLSKIWKELPGLLEAEQLTSLCLALKYLLEDTTLPTLGDLEMQLSGNSKSLIITNDRPEYQRLCSQIVYHLYVKLTEEKKEIPDILIQWKTFSENSVFPEVRKIWQY